MSGNDAEEKKHAPTQKKIRDLRKKGQVAKSNDLPQALSLAFVLMYMAIDFNNMKSRFLNMFEVVFVSMIRLDFATAVGAIIQPLLFLIAIMVIPPMIISTLITILTSAIDMKGLPMSGESIKPSLKKINPVEGVKKLFNVRNLVEIVKGLIKVTVLAVCTYAIGRYFLNSILISPSCKEACVAGIALQTVATILVVLTFILIIAALVDIPISRWLFQRDNKMTDTELKREQKEEMGDPHIRSARRQRHRQLIEGGPVGIDKANLLIFYDSIAIGINYVAGQTPAPIIVAKGTGNKALEHYNYCAGAGVYIYENAELATELIKRSPIGEFIPQAYFMPVAEALVEAGLV